MGKVHLSGLPLSAKVFCTLFLAGIGCGSLAAFAQASTAIGISPSAVKASLAPDMPMTDLGHGRMSAEKEIDPTPVLRAIVGDPARARAMGAAGRRRAETEFSAERSVETVEAAYREVLEATS